MGFLTLEALTKVYGDVAVVGDINLSVAKGEFVSLLGPVGLRQDHDLADDRGLRSKRRAGASRSTAATSRTCKPEPARPRHRVPELRAVSAHDASRRTSASAWRCASIAKRRAPRARARQALALVRLDALARSLSARAVRRPAPARGARARAGDRAAGAAARRAAVQPRRQAARGDAVRAARHPAQGRHHHDHGHARPGRGAVDQRPRGGDGSAAASRRSTRPIALYEHPATRFISHFIGKANMLPGSRRRGRRRRDRRARSSRCRSRAAGTALARRRHGRCCASARRRLQLRRRGQRPLRRHVSTSRFFLGSQWLYRSRQPAGERAACPRPNRRRRSRCDEGDARRPRLARTTAIRGCCTAAEARGRRHERGHGARRGTRWHLAAGRRRRCCCSRCSCWCRWR